ncbi:MAG: hypothetical protein M1481_03715 [Candidatus Thermoplasmatota archaeon]|nr:hypothetical protein [Candidatus Thermoplasmatota archaeon]MCL5963380.1 hypothetical protein [Candidatus Thermoplasmatota archaeon]
MEETICSVEFLKNEKEYLARIQSGAGGFREYHATSINDVLEQVITELEEEFESL